MAKVRLVSWSERTSEETTRDFSIPADTDDVKVEGDWLSCFNPTKGQCIYFRLSPNIKRVEIQYD